MIADCGVWCRYMLCAMVCDLTIPNHVKGCGVVNKTRDLGVTICVKIDDTDCGVWCRWCVVCYGVESDRIGDHTEPCNVARLWCDNG